MNADYYISTPATLDDCHFYGVICGNLGPRGQKVTGRLTFILAFTPVCACVHAHTHIHLYVDTHIYIYTHRYIYMPSLFEFYFTFTNITYSTNSQSFYNMWTWLIYLKLKLSLDLMKVLLHSIWILKEFFWKSKHVLVTENISCKMILSGFCKFHEIKVLHSKNVLWAEK